jgi:hypothetical protein
MNLTIIKYVAIASVVVALLGVGYNTAYTHGRLAGESDCIAKTEELIQQIHARISQVEKALDKVADLAEQQEVQMSKDIDTILKKIKAKPVVIVKNGKCVPTTNFLEGINEAIRRANQK